MCRSSINYFEKFLSIFALNATYVDSYTSKSENFLIKEYLRKGRTIQVIHRIRFENKHYYNQRFYIQMLQPDTETQLYIKELLELIVPWNKNTQFNPCINQLEIAHDIFTDTDKLYDLHTLLSHHLNLKHSRSNSVGSDMNTNYRGEDGDIWRGSKGSRCYIKVFGDEDDAATSCRFEPQLNGRFLREKNITIHSCPK
jgi:hypothetical protein